MPTPRDYVAAGQAGSAAGAAVRAAGGSQRAVSSAVTDAFREAMKSMEPQVSATTQAVNALSSAFRGLQTFGVQTSFAIHGITHALSAFGRSLSQFVQLANPAVVLRFNLAFQDFMGVLGRILLPLLQNVTVVFQKLADNLHSLMPAGKLLIGIIFGAAVGFSITAASIVAVNVALIGFNLLLDAASGGLASIFQLVGAALGAAAGISAGTLFAVGTLEDFKSILDAVLPPMMELVGLFAGAVMPVFQALIPVVVAAAQVLGAYYQIITPFIKLLAEAFSALVKPMVILVVVVAKLVSELAALFGENAKATDRAPPAVRPVQQGDIHSFITRQHAAALQGTQANKPERHLENIDRATTAIHLLLKYHPFFIAARQTASAVQAGVGGVEAGWIAVRAALGMLGGK